MSGFSTISAILRGSWLIDSNYAESMLPFVQSILNKNSGISMGPASKDAFEQYKNEEWQKFPQAGHIEAGVFVASRWKSFNEAPDDSIAVINISGPILKAGGECGEPGALHFNSWIKMANASPRIKGILLQIDSPGGMVDGTQTVVDAIRNSKKPIVAFIDDGMMASAATWIGTAAKEVYASQKTDRIGSIGVFRTIYDYTGWFEKMGIKVHEIYAPQSTDKNKDYYDALKGNYDPAKKELEFIANQFIDSIKSFREGKLNLSKGDPFTGKMFNADQAIEIGLIDGYMSIEEAVSRVYELANDSTKTEVYI